MVGQETVNGKQVNLSMYSYCFLMLPPIEFLQAFPPPCLCPIIIDPFSSNGNLFFFFPFNRSIFPTHLINKNRVFINSLHAYGDTEISIFNFHDGYLSPSIFPPWTRPPQRIRYLIVREKEINRSESFFFTRSRLR